MQCHRALTALSNNDLELLNSRCQAITQPPINPADQQEAVNFDVRDTYLLVNTTDTPISTPRPQLVQHISARLAQLDHAKRPASYAGSADEYDEDFAW